MDPDKNGFRQLAVHTEAIHIGWAFFEPDPKRTHPKNDFHEGDIILSPADSGLDLRMFYQGKIRGPKTLYYSDTGASPRTHFLLKCLLLEDTAELAAILRWKDVREGLWAPPSWAGTRALLSWRIPCLSNPYRSKYS